MSNCSQQVKSFLAQCLNNGMTIEEVDKKYYWLKDIAKEVSKDILSNLPKLENTKWIWDNVSKQYVPIVIENKINHE